MEYVPVILYQLQSLRDQTVAYFLWSSVIFGLFWLAVGLAGTYSAMKAVQHLLLNWEKPADDNDVGAWIVWAVLSGAAMAFGFGLFVSGTLDMVKAVVAPDLVFLERVKSLLLK